MLCGGWAPYETSTNILPHQSLIYEDIQDGIEFLIVTYPPDGQKYRLRVGIGCMRALLDPMDNVELKIEGLGDFNIGNKKLFPHLHMKTDYHKVSCKITSIEAYIAEY
ncbi:MAG: hypothetical protein AAF621_02255 [Pseudomonadota bacterium]